MATAIIPARGGSKGIPRKNLIDICGRPLVAWSIRQALAARCIDRVIVSSDCENIGAVATACGAEWLPRPAQISGDTSTTEAAVSHCLAELSISRELLVLLQPTSPIRQPHDIDAAVSLYQTSGADSVFSARHVEGFVWGEIDGQVLSEYDYQDRRRRQDLHRHTLEENGSIYVFSASHFRRADNRLGGRIAAYEMHPLDSFQVDGPADLDVIRHLMPLRLPQEFVHANAAA